MKASSLAAVLLLLPMGASAQELEFEPVPEPDASVEDEAEQAEPAVEPSEVPPPPSAPPGYDTEAHVWGSAPPTPPPPPPPPPAPGYGTASAPAQPAAADDSELASVGAFFGVGMGIGAALGLAGSFAVLDDTGGGGPEAALIFIFPLAGAIAGGYAGLFIASIYYAANGEPFTPGWAGLEVVLGGLVMLSTLAPLSEGGRLDDGETEGVVIGLLFGGWMVGHAIWSFATDDDAPTARTLQPTVSVLPGGAALGLVGRL